MVRGALQLPAPVPILAIPPKHNGDAELEIIVAATKGENVTWLHDYLLDWPKNIYVVDDQSAALTVPENKGREAMVVLTYVAHINDGQ